MDDIVILLGKICKGFRNSRPKRLFEAGPKIYLGTLRRERDLDFLTTPAKFGDLVL